MRKRTAVLAMVALSIPTAASANASEQQNPAQQCRMEQAGGSHSSESQGTNAKGANAFGKCVSERIHRGRRSVLSGRRTRMTS